MPSIRSNNGAGRKARLLALVKSFSTRRVLVIGDLIADEFVYGEVARVSREAPVLILKYDATQTLPGGAGNAASNVASLGARAIAAGIVGTDAEGRRLLASLPRRVAREGIVRSAGYRTPVKTRILAGGVHSAKQQVVRIDRATNSPLTPEVSRSFTRTLNAALATCDAVLLSDYGSGLVTPELAGFVKSAVGKRRASRVPVLVDSRYRLLEYRGLTTCTPNQAEVEQVLGRVIPDDDPEPLEQAGRTVLRRTGMEAVLLTRGSRGMALFERGRPTTHVPIFGSDEVADVTGAGDTVLATFGLALAAGATFVDAALLANYAGGIVVMKRGTATVSREELTAAVTAGES